MHRTATAADLGGAAAGAAQAHGGGSLLPPKNNEHYYASAVAQITVASRRGAPTTATDTIVVPITKTRTVVGRCREACDVTFEDSTTISAQHMAVYVMPSSLVFVEDLGSTNGSFLLTDPPMRLEPHVRIQWTDGRTPGQYGIALGGSGAAMVLHMSAVAFPDGRTVPSNVPPTLVDDEGDDDDDIPPPPALLNFERRKSQQDVQEAAPGDAAKAEVSAQAVSAPPSSAGASNHDARVAEMPHDAMGDLDATLDYKGSFVAPSPPAASGAHTTTTPNAANENAPGRGAASTDAVEASGGLAAFVSSPPQPIMAVPSTNGTSSTSLLHTGSGSRVGALSPTPPPGLPNTLASTKSTEGASLGDDDESPPPPSSAIRRRAAATGSAQGSTVHDEEPSPCPQTLDVSHITSSPAKRVLGYEEGEATDSTRAAPAAAAAEPIAATAQRQDTSTPLRCRDPSDGAGHNAPPAPSAVPTAAGTTPSSDASVQPSAKRHRAPSEDAQSPSPIAERVESSPTQASLVAASLSSTKKRGARVDHAVGVPVVLAEGGHAVLPLAAAPPTPPLPSTPAPAVERLYIPPLASPAPAAVVPPPTASVTAPTPHRATSASGTSAPTPPVATPSAGQWQFKVDLRKSNARDDAWEDYSAADSAAIELAHAAYQAAVVPGSKKKPKKAIAEAKLNATYGVHFEDMVQFRYDDRTRQRPVRRVAKH